MTWMNALWRLVSVLTGAVLAGVVLTDAVPSALSGLLLIAALAAALLLVLRGVTTARPAHAGQALRTRAERAGVPRHRDPDAPGRTRPRGPTARLVAAACA